MTDYFWNYDYTNADIQYRGISVATMQKLRGGWYLITGTGFRRFKSEIALRQHVSESLHKRGK